MNTTSSPFPPPTVGGRPVILANKNVNLQHQPAASTPSPGITPATAAAGDMNNMIQHPPNNMIEALEPTPINPTILPPMEQMAQMHRAPHLPMNAPMLSNMHNPYAALPPMPPMQQQHFLSAAAAQFPPFPVPPENIAAFHSAAAAQHQNAANYQLYLANMAQNQQQQPPAMGMAQMQQQYMQSPAMGMAQMQQHHIQQQQQPAAMYGLPVEPNRAMQAAYTAPANPAIPHPGTIPPTPAAFGYDASIMMTTNPLVVSTIPSAGNVVKNPPNPVQIIPEKTKSSRQNKSDKTSETTTEEKRNIDEICVNLDRMTEKLHDIQNQIKNDNLQEATNGSSNTGSSLKEKPPLKKKSPCKKKPPAVSTEVEEEEIEGWPPKYDDEEDYGIEEVECIEDSDDEDVVEVEAEVAVEPKRKKPKVMW